MKKMLLTVLAAVGVAAGTSLAMVPAASAAPATNPAWAYTGSNYGGSAIQLNYQTKSTIKTASPIHSVINKSGHDMCGGQYASGNDKYTYTFWNGGSWNVINYPFSTAPNNYHPLNAFHFGAC